MRYKNESKEKSNGVVYTPTDMAEYVAKQMMRYSHEGVNSTISILDPAVGEGELLIAIINKVLPSNKKIHVVGYETDEEVGKNTQARLETLYPSITVEIRIGDFLSSAEEGKIEKFDYVIANPPYIRTQILGSNKAHEIAEKLTLAGRVDIYYAFLVYAKDVLKKNGIAGFITSNKFMTIKSGNSVRNYMLENYDIHQITDLGDTKLFNASVLPCILIYSLGKTTEEQKVRFTSVYQCTSITELDGSIKIGGIFEAIEKQGLFSLSDGRVFTFQQGTIQSVEKNALWTINSNENSKWLARVESNTWMHFSDIGKVRVGIKTTADNVFIGNNWINEKSDLELLRPLITHRNAGQIVANSETNWKVLYTHRVLDGKTTAIDIEDYPKSKKYLLSHYEQLSKRQYLIKAKRNWYEIWVPQNPDSWNHKKIVFRDISEKPEFWLDDTDSVINGDCYWIDIKADILDDYVYLALAVANSRFIEKYYDCKFNNKLYSGKRRYQAQYVEQFPLPYYGTREAQQAVSIVKTILTNQHAESFHEMKNQLDSLVDKMFS